jgi:hypothetical protein
MQKLQLKDLIILKTVIPNIRQTLGIAYILSFTFDKKLAI